LVVVFAIEYLCKTDENRLQLVATGLFTCPIYLTISIVQSNIITNNGAQDYEKHRFIYPAGVHGLFGHVCTPKRKSGATMFTIPMTTTSTLDAAATTPMSSASFHNHCSINAHCYSHVPHIG
jgi:hypothetical protein